MVFVFRGGANYLFLVYFDCKTIRIILRCHQLFRILHRIKVCISTTINAIPSRSKGFIISQKHNRFLFFIRVGKVCHYARIFYSI